MNPRVNYEMTEADLAELLDACKPTRVMMIGGSTGPTPQENANNAWAKLGKKMGFNAMSVRPDPKGQRFFTAIPTETDAQRADRQMREAEERRQASIALLRTEIEERQARLDALIARWTEGRTEG